VLQITSVNFQQETPEIMARELVDSISEERWIGFTVHVSQRSAAFAFLYWPYLDLATP
jgi:hypothetical protein